MPGYQSRNTFSVPMFEMETISASSEHRSSITSATSVSILFDFAKMPSVLIVDEEVEVSGVKMLDEAAIGYLL